MNLEDLRLNISRDTLRRENFPVDQQEEFRLFAFELLASESASWEAPCGSERASRKRVPQNALVPFLQV